MAHTDGGYALTAPRLFPLIRHAGSEMFPLPRTNLSVPATAGLLRGYRTCQLHAGIGLMLHYEHPICLPVANTEEAQRHITGDLLQIPERDRNPVREILGDMGDQMDKGLGHRTYAHHSHFCEILGTPPKNCSARHPEGSFSVFAGPDMMVMTGTYDIDLREERREVWHNLARLWPDLSSVPELTYLRSVEDLSAREETAMMADSIPEVAPRDHILPVAIRPRSCFSNHEMIRLGREVHAFLDRLASIVPQIAEAEIQAPVFEPERPTA